MSLYYVILTHSFIFNNKSIIFLYFFIVLNILEKTDMIDCKPIDTPMDSNIKLMPAQEEPLRDPGRY